MKGSVAVSSTFDREDSAEYSTVLPIKMTAAALEPNRPYSTSVLVAAIVGHAKHLALIPQLLIYQHCLHNPGGAYWVHRHPVNEHESSIVNGHVLGSVPCLFHPSIPGWFLV